VGSGRASTRDGLRAKKPPNLLIEVILMCADPPGRSDAESP
jgi:hypothetical protein